MIAEALEDNLSVTYLLIFLAHDYWLHEFGITLQQLPIVLFPRIVAGVCVRN